MIAHRSATVFLFVAASCALRKDVRDDTPKPPADAADLASLREGFLRPPREAAPWVCWFWWDNVVSRGEILRELEELAAAGFGGAEIRIVTFRGWGGAPLPHRDPETLARLGHRKHPYLSDEWLDVLEFTCAQAERLGLSLALVLGQGWPPGGSWIPERHRSQHLGWTSEIFRGPAAWTPPAPIGESRVLTWRLAGPDDRSVEPGTFRDLTSMLRAPGLPRWEAPDGRWLIGIFTVTDGGLCDKGDGPEADPASREAIRFHLDHLFGRLDPKLRRYYGSTLVEFSTDSWEYHRGGKRYWSSAIPEAFTRRTGYDLHGAFHALLGYGPDPKGILADLESVERDLVHEAFFSTIADYLHERGLKHRAQAYGRGLDRDLLQSYALSDIPEVEQGICLPEAPWAARTNGRRLVTAEAYTFLSSKFPSSRERHGLWESTPAHLRWAANHFFGQGINRIHMHSFSYSPPGLPPPGWRMYAETHLNRNVPWWPWVDSLNTWLSRQQWVLQAGRPVADALVHPVRSNPPDGPFFALGMTQPVSAANAVDATNRGTLSRVPSAVAAGRYEVKYVVLLEAPETQAEAADLAALLEGGTKLLCCRALPADWPALRTVEAGPLRSRFAEAAALGQVIDARGDGWRSATERVRSVRWSPSDAAIVYQRRRLTDAELYFVLNQGDSFQGELSFPNPGQSPDMWNADTGRAAPVARFSERDGRIFIPVSLGPLESTIIVFSHASASLHVTEADAGDFLVDAQGAIQALFEQPGEYAVRLSDGSLSRFAVDLPPPLTVEGPWTLCVDGTRAVAPVAPQALRLERLASWRGIPELRHYAGTVTYAAEFDLPSTLTKKDLSLTLDLGDVFEVARVSLNGRAVGTAWTAPCRLDVGDAAVAGRNALRIEIANLLKNNLEQGDAYPRPSGLLGPVRVVPRRRITLAPGRVPDGDRR